MRASDDDVNATLPQHDRVVDDVQSRAIAYFLTLSAQGNILTPDREDPSAPTSIAAVGFSLVVYPLAAEKGIISRREAASLVLAALQRMAEGRQGEGPDGTIGHHGLFYHFLDRVTAVRTWHSEISLVDTAFLLAGALGAATYFDATDPCERAIREVADGLYRAADWNWALSGEGIIRHGWKPECGFLHYGWSGYSEAILLYVLALASPTHPISPASYCAWTSPYQWERIYGIDHLYAAPLFIHQFSHAWIDFNGIRDAFMRSKDCDYAENSCRTVLVQSEYARRNPRCHVGYGAGCWGLSAGPGPGDRTVALREPHSAALGYAARGIPYGPDDGTISPTAVAASLPFAPTLVPPVLRYLIDANPGLMRPLGLSSGFNPSVADANGNPWISRESFGIDQGAVALLIENHVSGFPWSLLRRCRHVRLGLQRAGFTGGWLERAAHA